MREFRPAAATDSPSNDIQILAIFPYSPNRIRIRSTEAIKELLKIGILDVIYLDDGADLDIPSGIRKLTVLPNSSAVKRLIRIVAGCFAGFPIHHEYYNSRALYQHLKTVDPEKYHTIYVERLPPHRLGIRAKRLIYDCVDCYSNLTEVLGRYYPGIKRILYRFDACLLPKEELLACDAASVVLVTADREKRLLEELGVRAPVVVWLHGGRTISPAREEFNPGIRTLSFHGKLTYPPNVLALTELQERILPRLNPAKYIFKVIGPCPMSLRRKFPSLSFTGYVDSIGEEIRKSDLCVLPLRISVGVSNKALEALASGVPVLLSPEVAGGLPVHDELLEAGVFVREIDDFVGFIDEFYLFDWGVRKRISDNCRSWAEELMDPERDKAMWQGLVRGSLCGG